MCGISGIINLKPTDINLRNEIVFINNKIKHRGPDGEGYVFINNSESICAGGSETPHEYFNNSLPFSPQKNINDVGNDYSVVLGHRRLSIIDLGATGHQPMCTSDKKLWITYNGEIYNYVELKKELQHLGYAFFTTSDTEVILNAYKQWGKDCLSRFNGMWAFVIYDINNNEIFAARDRFGVKPFYYYKDEKNFVFASEQKALVKSKLVKTGVNPAAVFDYFVKGELELEEEGVFKNIFELFPSHAIILNTKTGDFKKWKYFSLNINKQFELFDEHKFSQIKEKTTTLLVEAIKLRLRSDVPVGSCLSGGIDSSAIHGIMHRLLGDKKLNVYTATFNQKEFDESSWAKLMVDKTSAQWHKVTPTPEELVNDLETLVYSQDEPIWSTSTYAQYRVMKLVKESGIKVVLDGQGGDELFGGYNTQLPSYWIEMLQKGNFKNALNEINNSEGLTFFAKQYLRQYVFPKSPGVIKQKITNTFYHDLQYLNTDFWETYKHRITTEKETYTTLNEKLYSEFYNNRLKVYLKCEDRCSMWHSVESRTPFADDINLIEYIFSLPSTVKIHNGINKYLLREASESFITPQIKTRKDKMGYVTPHNNWMASIAPSFTDIYSNANNEFINTSKLKKDHLLFFTPKTPIENGRIFKYLCFPIWKKVLEI